jgi:hypothetical protein
VDAFGARQPEEQLSHAVHVRRAAGADRSAIARRDGIEMQPCDRLAHAALLVEHDDLPRKPRPGRRWGRRRDDRRSHAAVPADPQPQRDRRHRKNRCRDQQRALHPTFVARASFCAATLAESALERPLKRGYRRVPLDRSLQRAR